MRFLFVFLLACEVCCAGAESWRCDEHARIEGDLLVVDVPPGAKGGGASRTVDLSRFSKGVELRIRCCGENVTRPKEGWLGSRFLLHYRDDRGKDQWPHARQRSETWSAEPKSPASAVHRPTIPAAARCWTASARRRNVDDEPR